VKKKFRSFLYGGINLLCLYKKITLIILGPHNLIVVNPDYRILRYMASMI